MPLAAPGTLIDGRYRVVGPLGTGAMAEVYEAVDEVTGREVALKIMKRSLAREPETIKRLEREVMVQQMIRHPNVARIYGNGVTDNAEHYLVVELLRGRTLRQLIRAEGRVHIVRATTYVRQALAGLSAIHDAGVLHRDLKPANLMLEPTSEAIDRIVLIDFGFAAMKGRSRRLTAQGHVVGSLSYVAPERLHGGIGDGRADVYGMGIILYELLAGRRPFVATDEVELITMQLDQPPPSLREVAPDAAIGRSLEEVVLRALAKQPELRFQTALEMATAIDRAVAEDPASR